MSMELDKQAADRIIEALAPALDAELSRLSQEAYQRAQSEFEQARTSFRDQITEELRTEFQQSLQQEVQAANEQWAAERNQLQNQVDEWRGLAEAQRSLSR